MFVGIVKFYSQDTLIDANVITAENEDEGRTNLIEWYSPWLQYMEGREARLFAHVGDFGEIHVLTVHNVGGKLHMK